MIKYPYSNLKKYHGHYLKMVDALFASSYPTLSYKVEVAVNGFVIHIYNVNKHATRYRYISNGVNITSEDLLNTFYHVFPDIVPYIDFHLYQNNGINVETLSIRNSFYEREMVKHIVDGFSGKIF